MQIVIVCKQCGKGRIEDYCYNPNSEPECNALCQQCLADNATDLSLSDKDRAK